MTSLEANGIVINIVFSPPLDFMEAYGKAFLPGFHFFKFFFAIPAKQLFSVLF